MEMGIFVQNCPCLAEDLSAIFEAYWQATHAKSVDEIKRWKKTQKKALYNFNAPLRITYEGTKADVFIAVSFRDAQHADIVGAGHLEHQLSARAIPKTLQVKRTPRFTRTSTKKLVWLS